MPVRALPGGAWLAPGFIDVQVNGGGDVLFNDEPTAEGIAAIAAAHRRFGTTALLPTLISDTPEKMRAALAAVADGCSRQSERARHSPRRAVPVAGEAGRARSRRCSARLSRDDVELLTVAGATGVVLVTLAPERVPAGFIAELARAGRARLARAFHGDLRANAGGARRRPHRLHASLQCHAPARQPRAGSDCGRARERPAPGSA